MKERAGQQAGYCRFSNIHRIQFSGTKVQLSKWLTVFMNYSFLKYTASNISRLDKTKNSYPKEAKKTLRISGETASGALPAHSPPNRQPRQASIPTSTPKTRGDHKTIWLASRLISLTSCRVRHCLKTKQNKKYTPGWVTIL